MSRTAHGAVRGRDDHSGVDALELSLLSTSLLLVGAMLSLLLGGLVAPGSDD